MNVPQLRFDGFKESWTKVELKDIAESIKAGKSDFGSKLIGAVNNIPVLGSTGIIGYRADAEYKGDFILIARVGANAGRVNYYSGEVGISDNTIFLQPKKDSDFKFLLNYLYSIDLKKLSFGSGQPLIKSSELKKLSFYIPSLPEPKKISAFYTVLNRKIEIQKEKIEKLEQFKKGMMQKIFSQELRFKDEDGKAFDEWKLQTLDELGSFHKGSGLSKSHLTFSGQPCVLYGELYTKYSSVITKVYSYCNPEAKAFLGEVNDVLIPSSGETAWDIACASALNVSDVVLGGDLNVFRPNKKVDGNFISYQINSIKKYELSNLAQGASVVHLYSAALKKLEVFAPVYEEQLKISECLSKIDTKIEKEKEKLMVLEEQKKGFMQGMFV